MQQRFRIECSTVSEDRTSHSDQPMLSAFGAVSAIVQPLWRVEPSVIDLTGHVSNLKADHASSVKLPVKVIPADGANISIVGADIVRGNFKPRISVETHIVFIEFELQDIPLASSAELQVATDCKVRPFMSVKIVFP